MAATTKDAAFIRRRQSSCLKVAAVTAWAALQLLQLLPSTAAETLVVEDGTTGQLGEVYIPREDIDFGKLEQLLQRRRQLGEGGAAAQGDPAVGNSRDSKQLLGAR